MKAFKQFNSKEINKIKVELTDDIKDYLHKDMLQIKYANDFLQLIYKEKV